MEKLSFRMRSDAMREVHDTLFISVVHKIMKKDKMIRHALYV